MADPFASHKTVGSTFLEDKAVSGLYISVKGVPMDIVDGTSGTSADTPGGGRKKVSVSLLNDKYGLERGIQGQT